jgi:hypothetical protein
MKKKSKASAAQEKDEKPHLSAREMTELKRRIRDFDNPIRYVLASEFTPRFILYYNVSDDVYVMNEPEKGTLFKRLNAAENVKKLLGKHTVIVRFTTKGGKLKRLSRFHGMSNKKRKS